MNIEEKDIAILKLQKIDCLIKALGTMVMKPEYESDPNNIGSKLFKGSIQQPILLDNQREDALVKLNQLINSI